MRDWIRKSLANKIMAAVCVCTILVMASEIALRLQFGIGDRIEIIRAFSVELAAATYAGIRYPMAKGDSEAVKRVLIEVRRQMRDIEVYVCNFKKRITWSSEENLPSSDLDQIIADPKARDALAAMLESGQAPGRSFDEVAGGKKYLITLLPILNQSSCLHCHGSSRSVLGGMVIRADFQHSIERMTSATIQTVVVTLVGIAAMLILIHLLIDRLVRQPVASLAEGARQVADGDLSTIIAVNSDDEIGGLARSFNQMTRQLKTARDEIERWTHSLEELVEERTAQLKKAQESIIQAEKLASVGRMAAVVAHEINNPMAGIRTYARLLLKKKDLIFTGPESGEYGRYLETIESEAVRCGDIVKNLLQFSRPKKIQLQRQPLLPLIPNAVQLVQHQLDRCNCRVALDLGEEAVEVDCDSAKLKQALVALLINSCNVVGKGEGVIGISCRILPEKKVAIAISDNGPGMDEATKAHIFEPFFTTKLENLKEDSGCNIGLGLTVVDEIVRLHHGEIKVESQPGVGTTMTIVLPLAEAAPLARATARPSGINDGDRTS